MTAKSKSNKVEAPTKNVELPKSFTEQLAEMVWAIEPESRLPKLERLALLSAIMASSDEEPSRTASRALELWKACASALANSSVEEKLTRSVLEKFPSTGYVTVRRFLEECLPGSSDRTRTDKWQSFLNTSQGEDTISVAFGPSINRTESTSLEIDFPKNHLIKLWDAFANFLQDEKKTIDRDKSDKAQREKFLRSAARAVLGMQKLTEKQVRALKCLNERELYELMNRMEMPPRDRNKLKLGISDLEYSEHTRPRRRVVRSRTPGENP